MQKVNKTIPVPAVLRQDRPGFSLLELLVVVAIFSTVCAIGAAYAWDWLPDIRLRSAARDLYGNMQQARLLAVKNKANIALVYDSANERYAICTSNGADDDWTTYDDNGKESVVDIAQVYETGTIARVTDAADQFLGIPMTAIVFLPDGSSAGNGFMYLHNTNPKSNGSIYAVGARVANGKVILRKQ